MQQIKTDIAIFGGGIAGLWSLYRLQKAGFHCLLLESNALGEGQSINAQGIIHSGLKYSLTGQVTQDTSNICDLKKTWDACLEGKGEVDLRSVRVLSNQYMIWGDGSIFSNIKNVIGSKLLKSRNQFLVTQQYPELFQCDTFKGKLLSVDEKVLDMRSLIATLSNPYIEYLLKYELASLTIQPNDTNGINAISVSSSGGPILIKAQKYLFTTGAGHHFIQSQLPNTPDMQLRPLKMAFVEVPKQYQLFGHYLGIQPNPLLTITTHPTQSGKHVWYIGGDVAEKGAALSEQEMIKLTRSYLEKYLYWIDSSALKLKCKTVQRAEAKQPGLKRPSSPYLDAIDNILFGWPTKMTYAPKFADMMLQKIKNTTKPTAQPDMINFAQIPKPKISTPMWEI